ncbi:MAG: Spy/CpxP family protein refolding chaperone [Gemmatimonadota bacterium]|nr:Spy/CpxP family protein refolding chaperone [Gemmatimonadota bacterium]
MAIALCVASASVAVAQRPDSGPPGGRRGGLGPNLLEGITLTDAQQAQVKAIREKYAPQRMEIMNALRTSGMPPDSATRARLTGITEAQTTDIRAILTAEQQKILDKNVVDARERMKNRPPPGN